MHRIVVAWTVPPAILRRPVRHRRKAACPALLSVPVFALSAGGYVEFSVKLPGTAQQSGFWAATWLMGNLGRAGYYPSLEGMWPFSYDACENGDQAHDWNSNKTQRINRCSGRQGMPAAAEVGASVDGIGLSVCLLPPTSASCQVDGWPCWAAVERTPALRVFQQLSVCSDTLGVVLLVN